MELNQQFDRFLLTKPLSDKEKALSKNWLRFYWDFCNKYNASCSRSWSHFLQKLQDKNQTDLLQEEAKGAFSHFFEIRTGSVFPFEKNERGSLALKPK